ncbi:hypothetical protein MRB53_001977 [Persea americana]|uniref:Uncharacterized protein n=1 Tax=Persea americana TaxID=3435 RepID=A0ACC2MTC1_PERAE|nr:hypothetical protein MRB53_001977 [Persea americana]
MEERAKEEDKGLELMKQEESRFEGKRNKTKQGEEKEAEKEQDLPLLPDVDEECNLLVGSCPPSEDDAEEFYMVKEELGVDAGEQGVMVQGVTSIQLCVGMEFESEEAARKFYNGYARRVGFSIRASDFYRSKRTGEITSRRFVCARQGFHKRKDTLKHPRTSNREGCKAFMHVKRRDSGRWVVVRAVKEHNHDLMSVRKLHSLGSRRHLYDAAKSLIDSFEGVEEASSHSSPVPSEIFCGTNRNYGIGEFESSWEFLLNRYNLKDNDLLRSLYDVRWQWVPVYLRDTFFAGMSMVEQSGIPDSFFVGYVNAQATLQEFIGQYEKCVDTQYEKEVVADFETIHTKPFLKTASPIEKQAANIYTKEIFTKFQEELFETCAYTAHRYEEDGALSMYRVARFGEDHEACTVTFNTSKLQASCSCRMFEFSGILCRHLLTVFRVANVLSLPSHCFLKRWTRNAKSGTTLDDQATDLEGNCCSSLTGLTLRYNNLCQEAIKLAEEGAVSMDIYDVAVHALREALDKVLAAKNIVVNAMHDDEDSLFCGSFREDDVSGESQEENAAEHTKSCVPRLSKAEGRPLASKLKPGREKNSRKIRMCII